MDRRRRRYDSLISRRGCTVGAYNHSDEFESTQRAREVSAAMAESYLGAWQRELVCMQYAFDFSQDEIERSFQKVDNEIWCLYTFRTTRFR